MSYAEKGITSWSGLRPMAYELSITTVEATCPRIYSSKLGADDSQTDSRYSPTPIVNV